MKFKFLTGDVNWQTYGGKFVSKRLNNGDFDYYLVLDVINWHDATGDESQDKYNVSIQAVSPMAAGEEKVNQALGSMGLSDDQMTQYENEPLIQVEALVTYGIFAQLYTANGNNLNEMLKTARREADLIHGLFGFYMDRPENGLGQNGWQLIRGQDVREFLFGGGEG